MKSVLKSMLLLVGIGSGLVGIVWAGRDKNTPELQEIIKKTINEVSNVENEMKESIERLGKILRNYGQDLLHLNAQVEGLTSTINILSKTVRSLQEEPKENSR